MLEDLAYFHFLRPQWLLLGPGLLVFERLLRRPEQHADRFSKIIEPTLLEHLRIQKPGAARFNPRVSLVLLFSLLVVVLAGPTWRQQPSPLAEDTAPLVIVVDVSESMAMTDIAPSRLERGIQKIRDLLRQIPDKAIGVIAYAGSAHTVLPLTSDHDIAENFLQVLKPGIAPRAGKFPEYALPSIDRLLADSYFRSSVLLLTDGLGAASRPLMEAWCKTGEHRLFILGLGDPSPVQSSVPLDRPALKDLAGACSGRYFDLTVDAADVSAIARSLSDSYRIVDDEALPWLDSGYLLIFPMMGLALLWFRRGWTRLWVLLLIPLHLSLSEPGMAETPITEELPAGATRDTTGTHWGTGLLDGLVSLWLTPDQYGRLLLDLGYYNKAAQTFANPVWRATAHYYAQDFEQAALLFTRQDSNAAVFNEANARAHRRDYVGARDRYDRLLAVAPDFPGARDNREFVHVIIEASNRLSESQAEENGVGNEELDGDTDPQIGEGAERITIEPQERRQYSADEILASPETAALWMENVQPDPTTFLRSKFSAQLNERGVREP